MSKYSETVAKLADLARQINEDSERFWHPEKRPGVMMQIFPNSQLMNSHLTGITAAQRLSTTGLKTSRSVQIGVR